MLRSNARKKFMELYEPVHGRFERFCKARSYGVMEPRDLMHDAIVVALEKLKNIDQPRTLLSFLCGTAIRVLANQRRKIAESEITGSTQMPGVSSSAETDMAVAELYQALSKLPEPMGEAIILFEIAGFSIREIAAIQQSSEDAVKQRLKRGRQRLAKALQDEPVLMAEK